MTKTCDICYKESDLLIRVLRSELVDDEFGQPIEKKEWICYSCLADHGFRS